MYDCDTQRQRTQAEGVEINPFRPVLFEFFITCFTNDAYFYQEIDICKIFQETFFDVL